MLSFWMSWTGSLPVKLELIRTRAADIRREIIIDASLAGRLSAMARLRNILVHGYGRVDDRRVHHVLRENLGDLDAYLAAVNAYVQPPGGDTP